MTGRTPLPSARGKLISQCLSHLDVACEYLEYLRKVLTGTACMHQIKHQRLFVVNQGSFSTRDHLIRNIQHG